MTERPPRFGATTLARLRPARAQGHRHLLTGSAVLVVGAAIQALSGAVFWLIAARLDAESIVGAGGKLFTSVLFVTYLAGLGLPVALARYAADRDPESDTTFTWAVLATIGTSLLFGTTYVALFHGSATGLLTEVNPVLGPLFFAVMVAGAALSLIVDVRCMTARRWNLVLARITIVGHRPVPAAPPLPGRLTRPPGVLALRRGHRPGRAVGSASARGSCRTRRVGGTGSDRCPTAPGRWSGTRRSTTCRPSPTRRRTSCSR